MLNSVILMGRLTRDPELRKTNSGKSVCSFDLATDNIMKNPDGTRGSTFISCTIFEGVAESVATHLRKGSKVAVTGSLQQRNFLRKDGSKASVIEVIANSVEFLDDKPEEPEEPNAEDLPFDKPENDKVQEPVIPVAEPQEEAPKAKYDPYTGKPLKPAKK